VELDALQDAYDEIRECGASLVAASPEEPSFAEDTRKQHGLSYPLLFDDGNAAAEKFGLVFALADEVNDIFQNVLEVDLAEHNGDGSYELPIPATYVIGPDRTILNAFVHADYTKRMEPDDVVETLRNR